MPVLTPMRIFSPVVCAALFACGGNLVSSTPAPDGGPNRDTGVVDADGSSCGTPQPSWALTASEFSVSCAADSDCEDVYLGDDACGGSPGGICLCPNGAISRSSDAAYQNARAAITNSPSCMACQGAVGGCFCPAAPVFCNAGTCAVCTTPGPGGTCNDKPTDGGAGCQINSDCHKSSPDECNICSNSSLVCHAGACVCACQVGD